MTYRQWIHYQDALRKLGISDATWRRWVFEYEQKRNA
jgi:hypothetical protein